MGWLKGTKRRGKKDTEDVPQLENKVDIEREFLQNEIKTTFSDFEIFHDKYLQSIKRVGNFEERNRIMLRLSELIGLIENQAYSIQSQEGRIAWLKVVDAMKSGIKSIQLETGYVGEKKEEGVNINEREYNDEDRT